MKQKILIVDDNDAYASVLVSALKTHGFDALRIHDGRDTVQTAQAWKPDLILLDIMMPQMGGTEVRAELLKDAGTKDIPVIYLTGLRAPRYSAGTKAPFARAGSTVKTIGKSDDLKELLAVILDELAD